jgi:putative endonuclease
MPAHPTPAQASGGEAEQIAERFLVGHGLRIVARNYRTRQGEIDLVVQDGDVLVFVEVRMRSGARFGGALGSIHARKRARIVAAARHFLMRLGREPRCRFDVITVEAAGPAWLRGAFETT